MESGLGSSSQCIHTTPSTLTQLPCKHQTLVFTCPFEPLLHSTGFIRENEKKTYNTRDSLVVTDPTTDLALTNLIKGERTGSHVLSRIWSYVTVGG